MKIINKAMLVPGGLLVFYAAVSAPWASESPREFLSHILKFIRNIY